jgi:hypothetical protein
MRAASCEKNWKKNGENFWEIIFRAVKFFVSPKKMGRLPNPKTSF